VLPFTDFLTTLDLGSELYTDVVIYNRTYTLINHKSIAITIAMSKLEKLVYLHFNT
jgi:hypothetical protein